MLLLVLLAIHGPLKKHAQSTCLARVKPVCWPVFLHAHLTLPQIQKFACQAARVCLCLCVCVCVCVSRIQACMSASQFGLTGRMRQRGIEENCQHRTNCRVDAHERLFPIAHTGRNCHQRATTCPCCTGRVVMYSSLPIVKKSTNSWKQQRLHIRARCLLQIRFTMQHGPVRASLNTLGFLARASTRFGSNID